MYTCLCYAVTEEQVREQIAQGCDVAALQQRLKIGTCCGCCNDDIAALLQQASQADLKSGD